MGSGTFEEVSPCSIRASPGALGRGTFSGMSSRRLRGPSLPGEPCHALRALSPTPQLFPQGGKLPCACDGLADHGLRLAFDGYRGLSLTLGGRRPAWRVGHRPDCSILP